jgi:uncharacterized membrane protein YjjP (DUF1212 family)
MSELHEQIDFVLELGMAYHRYGASAYRCEAALRKISPIFGLDGQFYFTPTLIVASFKTPEGYISRLQRVDLGVENLDKLNRVDAIADIVYTGNISASEGSARIQKVISDRNLYSDFWLVLSFAIAAVALSVLFGGRWRELAPSFTLGMIVGLIDFVAKRIPRIADLFEAIAAFVVAIAASTWQYFQPQISLPIVAISSLVILLPGLTLTVGMAELATRHLASGTSRLMSAITTLLKLAFGFILGIKLMHLAFATAIAIPIHPFEWPIKSIAVIVAALALMIQFQAYLKDIGWMILAGIGGLLGTYLGIIIFGSELGVFCGAVVVGAGSNLFSRYFLRPSATIFLPGIIFLVPGSIGFKGMSLLFEQQVLIGIGSLLQMLVIAISIVSGIFFGNLIIPPRREL